ncbi:MAG: hypothetical protein HY237_13445, partial [Acidobacteria bacterium]|nr:hypothetical protein [Acidobacteriota bacterium]
MSHKPPSPFMSSLKRGSLLLVFAGATAAALLWAAGRYAGLHASLEMLFAAKWLAIAGLLG